MDDRWIPFLVLGLIVFIIVKRGRRLMGATRFWRWQFALRFAFVGLVTAFLFPLFASTKGLPVVLGLAVGSGLGIAGALTTRFEAVDGKLVYVPNPWIGLGVWLFFIGRLIYRWIRVGAMFVAASGGGTVPLTEQFASPWARASLFVLLGYFLLYSAVVLIRSRGVTAQNVSGSSSARS